MDFKYAPVAGSPDCKQAVKYRGLEQARSAKAQDPGMQIVSHLWPGP